MNDYKCVGKNCKRPGRRMTWGEYKYSINAFRKRLCVDCQKEERIKQNPDTGKLVNEQIERDYVNKHKRDSKE